MNANSKLVAVATVSAIAGATFLGANSVSAHQNGESLVSKIAERFDASEDEVQAVVDEVKAEDQAEHEAARAEQLDSLVEDGTLSEEQRAELESFAEDRQSQRDELREQDLTREEMKEAMQGLRDEIEAWAEAEGIDLEELRGDNDRGDRRENRRERRQELNDRLEAEFGEPVDDEADTTDAS